MNTPTTFYPPRRRGLVLQIGSSLVLLALGGICLLQGLAAELGLVFLVFMALALILFAPVPILIYRIYGLLTSRYTLERDGIRIRWGLRSEDIPLPEIEWIRPAADLPTFYLPVSFTRFKSMPLPWLHWPGSLIGSRQVEALGKVEFIASEESTLLLIATPQRIFAISPLDPQGFVRGFNAINEMGSLAPLEARSLYPTFLMARLYADRIGRYLLLAGLGLGAVLLIWVALTIPAHASLSIGFSPTGTPLDLGPPERLLLLPILYGLSYLSAFLAGAFFYRRPDQKLLAYILWSANILQALLLLGAVATVSG
jgi:hypothetical protein